MGNLKTQLRIYELKQERYLDFHIGVKIYGISVGKEGLLGSLFQKALKNGPITRVDGGERVTENELRWE